MKFLNSLYDALTQGRARSEADLSPMERLPQDILILILLSIDDLRSLRATVLASSAMYDAFKTAKTETLANVVSRSRPAEIKLDAVALSVLMEIQEQNSPVSMELFERALHHPQEEWAFLPRDLSSPRLLHFHWFVEYFTEKLFKSAMRETHRRGWLGTYRLKFRKLSQNEIVRLHRALYRLELFHSLMKLDRMASSELKATAYWRSTVSVWDMEEIACVHELLCQRLGVLDCTIIDIIENTTLLCHHQDQALRKDIKWVSTTKGLIKDLILSQGLAVLFRILSRPESRFTNLKIREIVNASIRHETTKHYTMHQVCREVTLYIPEPIFAEWLHGRNVCTLKIDRLQDPEDTPEYPSFGYIRAYRVETLKQIRSGQMSRTESFLCHRIDRVDDRTWGYCLWDKERMEWWGDSYLGAPQRPERSQLRVTSRRSPRRQSI